MLLIFDQTKVKNKLGKLATLAVQQRAIRWQYISNCCALYHNNNTRHQRDMKTRRAERWDEDYGGLAARSSILL